MKKTLPFILSIFILALSYAQTDDNEMSAEEIKALIKQYDSIEKSFKYQYGKIKLRNNLATLNVPKGFKYLNAEQSKVVLEDLWGNPPEATLGMLFNENETPLSDNLSFAIEIQYENEGYISDDDAKDFDYNELLESMQKDITKLNPERKKQGYPTMELVRWASPPYYDNQTKKLYWAKEMKFESADVNTLNYNIRILGRKGYLMLNAIGDMTVLPKFEKEKDNIIASVEFNEGNKYADFDSSTDKIAAYGIGGLIAGKVLAKAGFFALILKFGKFIVIGLLAFFGKFKNKLFGSKKMDNEIETHDTTQDL